MLTGTAFGLLDANHPRRAATVMVEVLRSEGVRYVFGNPGATKMPLIDALDGVQDISHILGLQEAAVVAMADGYAKASGRPGFVNVDTAGGLGHAMGALLHSHVANTPLVITIGQQDTRHCAMEPLLGGDVVSIARPVAKWACEVAHADHLPMLLRRAFNDCTAAPSGPVFLSLPMDIMEQVTAVTAGAKSRINRAAVANGLDELTDALVLVRRLAIIAGDEVSSANAVAEIIELAEALGAPVFGPSWPSYQSFPATHPLWEGNLPAKAPEMHGCLEAFDAVFALGGHSLITDLYAQGPALPAHCRLFQLSADATNLGRIYSTTLSWQGDIRASLRALLPELHRRLEHHESEIATVIEHAAQVQAARRAELQRLVENQINTVPATALAAAHELLRGIGSRAAIVDESPVTMRSMRACLCAAASRAYLFMRSAIPGWGMPAAVGVSLGLGREPVVALLDAGSSLYSPQALWTAARERLPVTFVVMNSSRCWTSKDYLRAREQGAGVGPCRFAGRDPIDPGVDYVALARSMGVPALRVARATDIAGAVESAIQSGIPSLIDLPMAP